MPWCRLRKFALLKDFRGACIVFFRLVGIMSGIANFMMNVSTGMSGRAVRTCLSTECRFGLLSSENITFSREPSCKLGFRDEKSWKHSDSARFMAAVRSDGSAASYAAMHRSAYSRSLAAHWALFISLLLIVFFIFRHERKKYTLPKRKSPSKFRRLLENP